MKSTKFNVLFVIAAWIIFIASGRNIYASVILMCAGAYMLVDVIGRLMKRKRWIMEEKKKRPQDRWDEKAGMISKTYKVNKKVAEEFQVACKEKGIAMCVQLTNMMKEFIENNK